MDSTPRARRSGLGPSRRSTRPATATSSGPLDHERGRTVVAVLHDLDQAARHADNLVAETGGMVAQGPPRDVVTAGMARDVSEDVPDPVTGGPLVVPAMVWRPEPEDRRVR